MKPVTGTDAPPGPGRAAGPGGPGNGPGGPGGPGGPPPEMLRLLQMLTAPWIAQALYVVAKFDLAEALADGPKTSDALAEGAALHPATVYRFLRTLASVGVFTEVDSHTFALTDLGRRMCGDVPGSMKYSALLFGEETFRSWAEIEYTARTGRPAFDEVYGRPYYDYVAEHPQVGEVFNRVMGGAAAGLVPAIVAELDFTECNRVVDVGGGNGTLVADVLGRHDHLTGTLVDLPAAVADAPDTLGAAGVADRCEVVAGSFFDDVPSGGDAYLLSRVLHNWSDEDALRILRNIHTAMAGKGQLMIFERLLPDGDDYHLGKVFDLVMMVVLGGRDRSATEYETLLDTAGFTVAQRRTDVGDLGVVIARPR
jgi:hypothetical protein